MTGFREVVFCEFCGKAANPEDPGTVRKVTGWISRRHAGGANHIRFQESLGVFAHFACLEAEERPVRAHQETLL